MRIERYVSQAVYSARLVERALHDPGPWLLRWAGIEQAALRSVSELQVDFYATYPEHCFIVDPDPLLELLCDGELVAAVDLVREGRDAPAQVRWTLVAEAPRSVRAWQ